MNKKDMKLLNLLIKENIDKYNSFLNSIEETSDEYFVNLKIKHNLKIEELQKLQVKINNL